MPRPVKNIFTEKWMKEFEAMVRESSGKRQASGKRRKRQASSKPEPSSGSEDSSVKPETQAS
jgi:hypothetical protein